MSITTAPIQKMTKAEALLGADKISSKKVILYVDNTNKLFAIMNNIHYTLVPSGVGADAIITLTPTV